MATAATEQTVRPLSQNYQVFLNFRGVDTRKTFTDHLYQRLVDARVFSFRDSEELHVGEEIDTNLLAAIKTSKISIAIISPNYADSKWCLHELVQILKCRETMGQIVIPIFYHVDPSDVRHQTGSFGERFSLQKKKHGSKVIQEWKEALEKVASLKVLELNDNADGHEGKLVKQVVKKVLTVLEKTTLVVPEYLVEVENKVKDIMEMVDLQSPNDVQFLLIYGMGGIGKTTLAKILYNQLSNQFSYCSFLENVRETQIRELQKQLISNILKQDWPHDIYNANEGINIIKEKLEGMKILVVLDDVDHRGKVDDLLGKYDRLGQGSIVIITTRKRDVLNSRQVKLSDYEVKELDVHQSFQLFCKHALQRGDSHDKFETIARHIVSTTGGLPLAIEVIGCHLSGRGLDFWKDTLMKLKRMPNEDVLSRLRICYETLSYEQKQIFLDISCLYPLKEELSSFMYIWDDREYYPRSTIEELKSLCLIKVRDGNQLTMHDQLRLLGREIVKQESGYQVGRRRIIWDPKEALEVMEMDQGTDQIEALNLALDKRSKEVRSKKKRERSEEDCFTSQQFKRLKNLRLLQLANANLVGDFNRRFSSLKWLMWHGCSSNFMATRFRPKHLVVLNLSESHITEQWGGWSELKCAEKLKVLDLHECDHLKATPDLSIFRELEILNLSYCRRLRKIHPLAETLISLNLQGCGELKELPIEVAEGFMIKLKYLLLGNCLKLTGLPEPIRSLITLKRLDLFGCQSLTTIPKSIGSLTTLKQLDLSGCPSLTTIPESIGSLTTLKRLDFSRCPSLTTIPESIGSLTTLKQLNLSGCHSLTTIPESIGSLATLKWLSLSGFRSLTTIPESIGSLTTLESLGLLGCWSLTTIPESIGSLATLEGLYLSGCQSLTTIPESIGSLATLKWLDLFGCQSLTTIPESIGSLPTLEELNLSGCQSLTIIPKSIGSLPTFEELYLSGC